MALGDKKLGTEYLRILADDIEFVASKVDGITIHNMDRAITSAIGILDLAVSLARQEFTRRSSLP